MLAPTAPGEKMHLKCHCSNIEIEVETKPDTLTVCNCSICSRYGSIWGYYPPADTAIEIGDAGAGSYLWGDKCIEFVHCKACGCVTHYQTLEGDKNPKVGVNFRMAAPCDIANISIRHFDGASM